MSAASGLANLALAFLAFVLEGDDLALELALALTLDRVFFFAFALVFVFGPAFLAGFFLTLAAFVVASLSPSIRPRLVLMTYIFVFKLPRPY